MTLTIHDLATKFSSGQINRKEFERILEDVIHDEFGDVEIKGLRYTKQGVEIETTEGEVEVRIDWDEIRLTD